MYALSRERVYTCYLGNDAFVLFVVTRQYLLPRNMITEPLYSNGRLVPTPLLRLSGVMSQYITLSERKISALWTGQNVKEAIVTGFQLLYCCLPAVTEDNLYNSESEESISEPEY
jgi:hypothetical protein